LPIGKAKRAHTEMPTDAGEDRIWVGELWPQPLVVWKVVAHSRRSEVHDSSLMMRLSRVHADAFN